MKGASVNYGSIRMEREGTLATITLAPAAGMSTLTAAVVDELAQAVAACEDEAEIRALILTGTGPAFCVGADMAMLRGLGGTEGHRLAEIADRFHERLIAPLRRLPKPVIAAVNGVAAGGGLGLALACDFRLAAAEARFNVAYARIGLSPDGGNSFFLPRLVGYARAMELYFLNDVISAEEARAAGLVSRVVPAAELLPAARELAGRLADGPTVAFGQTKRLFDRALTSDLAGHLAEESRALGLCAGTRDHAEGLAAFLAKRPPQFTGQ